MGAPMVDGNNQPCLHKHPQEPTQHGQPGKDWGLPRQMKKNGSSGRNAWAGQSPSLTVYLDHDRLTHIPDAHQAFCLSPQPLFPQSSGPPLLPQHWLPASRSQSQTAEGASELTAPSSASLSAVGLWRQ